MEIDEMDLRPAKHHSRLHEEAVSYYETELAKERKRENGEFIQTGPEVSGLYVNDK